MIGAMLRFLQREPKAPAPVWHRVRVREISGGFRYRHRDGDLRDAAPGEIVEVDGPTFDAVHAKVDIV